MILLKSKQYMLVGLTAVALTLSACGGDSAKNGATTKAPDTEEPAPSVTGIDTDSDGITDAFDKCPNLANAGPGENDDIDGDGKGNACDDDDDGDGILDLKPGTETPLDNCRLVPNSNQSNLISPSTFAGDACENDFDGDGITNDKDRCPNTQNLGTDADGDGIDDACDDSDGDGVIDRIDNCPLVPNANQLNSDGLNNGGDACDTSGDKDGDGIPDGVDDCPLIPNPSQNGCLDNSDGDTFNNVDDNCPTVTNQDQADFNNDGVGDACSDSDGDGVIDSADNCPMDINPLQENSDGAFETIKRGDACDEDDDNDDVLDTVDNCQFAFNPKQEDRERTTLNPGGDGRGDACDLDGDSDGVSDSADTCPTVPNPTQETKFCAADSDGDGITDPADNCPTVPNPDQLNTDVATGDTTGDACESVALGGDGDTDGDGFKDFDADGNKFDLCQFTPSATNEARFCTNDIDNDGVINDLDNCPADSNANQTDLDQDGKGDTCDDDKDGDKVSDDADNCPLIANPDQSTKPCDLAANIGNLQCDSYTVATVEPIVKGALCQILGALNNPLGLCGVNNATAAADGSDQSFATINNAVVLPDSLAGNLLTGEVGVRVKLPAERKKGSIAAMEIEIPGGTVDLTLFRNIKLVTKLKGVVQERRETLGEFTTNPGNAFSLDVLGFSPIGSSARALLGFVSTKDFDSIELTVTAGLSVDLLEQLRVYDTCSAASVKPGTTAGPGTPPSTNPLDGTPLGDLASMIPGLGGGAFPPELPGAGSGEDPFAIFTDPEGPFAPLVALFSDPVGTFTTFAEMFTGFFSNPGAAFSGLTDMFNPAS